MRHLVAIALTILCPAVSSAATSLFADFDRRARQGERLNVVFLGASLTWGANASDPQLTSFRGLISQRLEKEYSLARFKFWDAAIGGTGSQLGVFRLERDVLQRRPDLVFLDFSANDDIYSDTPETLASYEALVRRLVVEAQVPVVQVIFPFEWNVAAGKLDGMKRRDAHHAIARAYHIASGDAIALAQQRVRAGTVTLKQLWPVDGVHPGDRGYALFTEAAWTALQDAIREKRSCAAPARMLHADTYMKNARVRLSSLAPLAAGWRVGSPNVVSAYFDMLMSRWQDDQVIASNRVCGSLEKKPVFHPPGPLKMRFHGSMVLLFGESTTKSGKYQVFIDGKRIDHRENKDQPLDKEFDAAALAKRVNGNTHLVQVLAEGLDPQIEHTLEIDPVLVPDREQELRFESICVAGGTAKVSRHP